MHFTRSFLISALAAAPATASWFGERSVKNPGRFEMQLQRKSSLRSLTTRGDGDEAVSTIYNGTDWVTEVNLGGQKVILQIDTGSADL